MTREEKNHAIAVFLDLKGLQTGNNRKEPAPLGQRWVYQKDAGGGCYEWAFIPDYCGDLNAIWSAVKCLSIKQNARFCTELWNMCDGASGPDGAINANADLRVTAFLRAIGKIKRCCNNDHTYR